jgi:hypothetical protein
VALAGIGLGFSSPPLTDPLNNSAAEKRGLTVWRMTKRARERFLKGAPPVFRRRPPDRESFVNDPREDLYRGYDRPDNWEIRLWPLPSLIVCPKCERVQLITDEVLPPLDRVVLLSDELKTPVSAPGNQTAGEPTKTAE